MKCIHYFLLGHLLLFCSCGTTKQLMFSMNLQDVVLENESIINESKATQDSFETEDFSFKITHNVRFFTLSIKNLTKDNLSFIWDEASITDPDDLSGRMLNGKTRVIHSAQTQLSTPIPPGGIFTAQACSSNQIASNGYINNIFETMSKSSKRLIAYYEYLVATEHFIKLCIPIKNMTTGVTNRYFLTFKIDSISAY